MNIKRITPGEEIAFPCWLWNREMYVPDWVHFHEVHIWKDLRTQSFIDAGFTHRAPDGPKPTEAPEEGAPPSSPQPVPSDVREAVEKNYADHFMGDSTNGVVLREAILSALAPHWQKMERRVTFAESSRQSALDCNADLNKQFFAKSLALDKAQAENAKLREDGERLDWLEQQSLLPDEWTELCEKWRWDGKRYSQGLRAAIDAARSQQGGAS